MRDYIEIVKGASTLDLLEMANLSEKKTGVRGVIYISSRQGSHGPRFKWYASRPPNAPNLSVVLSEEPTIINHTVDDRLVREISPDLIKWGKLNRDALIWFWENGTSLIDDELDKFKKSLVKI